MQKDDEKIYSGICIARNGMMSRITKISVVVLIILILGGVAYLVNNDSKETVKLNEGLVVYTYVNFREEPALDGKIIEE